MNKGYFKSILTKEILIKYYIINKLTCKQIGLIYGCNWNTILDALIRNKIPRRKPLTGKELARKYGHQTRFKNGHKSLVIKRKKLLTSDGYVYLYKPEHPSATKDGHIKEHRFVMEQYIGRYLTDIEIVHHINEIKTDNRIENLILCKDRAEHNSYHKSNLGVRQCND